MKKIKIITISILFVLISNTALAGNKTLKIKTSAICDMCKNRIELVVNNLKGVKKSFLNLKTKVLIVKFDDKILTEEKIKNTISEAGYDAGDIKKDLKAYAVLPSCCKSGSSCDVKK